MSPTTAIINAGKSRIYGVEAEVSASPVQGLTLDLNYTYLKAEIREIATVSTTDPNYVASAGTITPGSPLVLSPKNKYTFSGKYVLPLEKSIGDIFVGAVFSHVDKQLANYNYFNPATVAAVGGNFGYLSSRKDSDLLMSEEWRDLSSGAIVTAVQRFFATRLANRGTAAVSP